MVRLKLWQWIVLATPLAFIIAFLLISAGVQIHAWGINWIWGVFTLLFVGWRWLLVKWTQPGLAQLEAVVAEVSEQLRATDETPTTKAEIALQEVLSSAQSDRPIWEDWQTFWQRCQDLVVAISQIYYPQVKYPLLNIYVPQAYTLIQGTVDDLARWMQKLSPALNQVTIGQAYQAYEVYQKMEPSARKLMQAWGWAQWLLNPVAAVAKKATQGYGNRATQQLLGNLSQMLREAALKSLCRQAVLLYGGEIIATSKPTPIPQTQTLRDILTIAEPRTAVEQKPVNILLAGRTGSGKSSLINTLFQAELAAVDVLPSTDRLQNYQWHQGDETLTLWDTPGYEQVNRSDFRDLVLDYAKNADLLLLVTPALDPSLQMDVDFLADMKADITDLPTITVLSQVDRLRPIREWEPPYDWEWGDRPKEVSIRQASQYRVELLGEFCELVLPIVSSDVKTNRVGWGVDALSLALISAIAPSKQLRLARFLRNLEARTVAAAQIIDNYTFQMATGQGLTALLKSPVLQFISTVSTGSPNLAYLLAEKIPVEQLPVVIGKLQMAYELFSLLVTGDGKQKRSFDLLSLWSLLLENTASCDRNAWAFGHALVEYWTQNLTVEQLRQRFEYYLTKAN